MRGFRGLISPQAIDEGECQGARVGHDIHAELLLGVVRMQAGRPGGKNVVGLELQVCGAPCDGPFQARIEAPEAVDVGYTLHARCDGRCV